MINKLLWIGTLLGVLFGIIFGLLISNILSINEFKYDSGYIIECYELCDAVLGECTTELNYTHNMCIPILLNCNNICYSKYLLLKEGILKKMSKSF